MRIADALQRSADASGMSDVEIAAAVGVAESTVGRWLHGKASPRGPQLIALIERVPGFGKALAINESVPARYERGT